MPLLKKTGLDTNVLANYRPVSNLPFLGKVIEKVVAQQITQHMSLQALGDDLQSAYKPGHSCETALVQVTSYILLSLDKGHAVLLTMLDLSAAFDLVDHETLLLRMRNLLGFSGKVIDWFRSYLAERSQSVLISCEQSSPVNLDTGIPQGSVLGPLMYLIYTLPMKQLLQSHGVQYHCFADDTQIYVKFSLQEGGLSHSLHKLESCINDLKDWFTGNKLMLNTNKTEFIVFTSPRNQVKVNMEECVMHIGGDIIKPSKCVRDLGSYLDSNLSMDSHINMVIRSVYGQLRTTGKIRKFLDTDACATAINSLVTSRLDYNNALLFGVPEKSLRRLQIMQNQAARILAKVDCHEHITPVLVSLHWLPIRARIDYKILVLVYKCIHQEFSSSI